MSVLYFILFMILIMYIIIYKNKDSVPLLNKRNKFDKCKYL